MSSSGLPAAAQPSPAWAREYELMAEAYRTAGGDPRVFDVPDTAGLVVSGGRVLAAREVPGVAMHAEPRPNGVRVEVRVEPGTRVRHPVHLCFGLLPEEGLQEVVARYEIGEGASVPFLAHCTFPRARAVRHVMDARIELAPGASMSYTEAHFHGPFGGIEVLPKAQVLVGPGASFRTQFELLRGRVGRLHIRYDVAVAAGGLAELITRLLGSAADRATVHEVVRLDGEGARGLTKTRVAVKDEAVSRVITCMEGNAPFARGHMDCVEVVRGAARAHNMPVVLVRDERAHVTHEAAIGKVNQKELETLMARGLDEDEAVDLIIRGMLGGQ